MQQLEQTAIQQQDASSDASAKDVKVALLSKRHNLKTLTETAHKKFKAVHKHLYVTKSSLNYAVQQKECNRINVENARMASSLINQKPTISFAKFDQENASKKNI